MADGGTSETPREWLVRALGGGQTTAGVRVGADTVEGLDTAYACIGVLSETVGQTPLKFLAPTNNGGRREFRESPIFRLLHEQPNPECTAGQFKACLTRQAVTYGAAYAEIVRNAFGEPIAIWPLLSTHMAVDREPGTRQLRYRYTLPGNEGTWTYVRRPGEPSRILHLPINSTDGVNGRSPIRVLAETFGWAAATNEYGARFFANDATPKTVLMYPGKLDAQGVAAENIRRSWQEKFGGLQNAHRIAVLQEGAKIERIGIPPNEAQFLETMRFAVERICRIYRVPPFMVGHTDKTTSWGTGIGDMQVGFATYTMMWWFLLWQEVIQRDVVGYGSETYRDGGQALFVTNALLKGDALKRFQSYRIGRELGMYNANDLLALEDMNPRADEGGEAYWTQPGNGGGASASENDELRSELADLREQVERLRGMAA